MTTLTDKSLMPMGTYKNIQLEHVPASHLLWYLDQDWFDKNSPLGRYIIANKAVLEHQVKQDKFFKKIVVWNHKTQ